MARNISVTTQLAGESGGCMGCHGTGRRVRVVRLHTTKMRLCVACAKVVAKGLKSGSTSVVEQVEFVER